MYSHAYNDINIEYEVYLHDEEYLTFRNAAAKKALLKILVNSKEERERIKRSLLELGERRKKDIGTEINVMMEGYLLGDGLDYSEHTEILNSGDVYEVYKKAVEETEYQEKLEKIKGTPDYEAKLRELNRQQFIKEQRRLLTPALRYEVMKRDHFHCVLCGRGAEDGVKLEVDHIIPVSKGGKTEMSNLRTLCFDCNRGKSDKEE